MLSLMLYCMLRAGDLINLQDDDIDMKAMTLRIRDGKFGKFCHTAHTRNLYANFIAVSTHQAADR